MSLVSGFPVDVLEDLCCLSGVSAGGIFTKANLCSTQTLLFMKTAWRPSIVDFQESRRNFKLASVNNVRFLALPPYHKCHISPEDSCCVNFQIKKVASLSLPEGNYGVMQWQAIYVFWMVSPPNSCSGSEMEAGNGLATSLSFPTLERVQGLRSKADSPSLACSIISYFIIRII